MDRRHFLQATLAAGAASALPVAFAAGPLKVAVMIPQSGPAGLFGPSSKACAEMAAANLNARGGVLGRKIELLFGDAGLAPAEAGQAALKLWKGQKAEAVIGMHDSAVRGALVGLFKGQVPYFYTPVYEGGECAKGTYVKGETPQQQLEPVIPWLAGERKPTKWYMIGNDYIWGRNTNAAAKGYIEKTGAKVVGDEYLPFTVDNFDASLARIRDSGADAVLVSLVGGASVTFNKAFASFGLSDKAIRLGTLIEENTLAGIGVGNARNLYSSSGYFATIDTPAAKAFAAEYAKANGANAPALNGLAESTYEGFLMLEALAKKANSLDTAKLDAASEGTTYTGPRGSATIKARHVEQDIYVADVTDKGFRVVKTFPKVGAGQTCKV
ncbi:substrate-binding domain-containing protein [Variovorax sp. KK3]|uniref:substrate-binding domain-containing protein n=1 Tax=Variovorax sp. KK3 TaxID=1855728 RepID=UPI00097CBDF6|nr:substrate-binding domain-containing protein [Variovorax sp. KK3]